MPNFQRFSLRTLLLVITCIACGLGVWMWYLKKVTRQQEAVRVIRGEKREHCQVWYDYQFRSEPCSIEGVPIRRLNAKSTIWDYGLGKDFWHSVVQCEVNWGYPFATPDDQSRKQILQGVENLAQLKFLEVNANGIITSEDLQRFACRDSLEGLDWTGDVTNQHWAAICEWKRLKVLHLETRFQGRGLSAVTDFSPLLKLRELRKVEAPHSQATDDFVLALSNNQQLQYLNLQKVNITDRGALAIGNFRRLKYLKLWDNPELTSAGIATWNQLTELEELRLGETKIDDRLWDVVSQMPKLRIAQTWYLPSVGEGFTKPGAGQSLEELSIGAELSPAALTAIARLARLKTLALHASMVKTTDDPQSKYDSLILPDGFATLRELELCNVSITPALWQSVCRLHNLEDLSIRVCSGMGNAMSLGLVLSKLKSIEVHHTPLTREAMLQFVTANPHVKRLRLDNCGLKLNDLRVIQRVSGMQVIGDCEDGTIHE
jgi:hypothetical protein